jgi:peptide/nickel transport system permease protein
MLTLIGRRVLQMTLVLWLFLTVLFFMLHLAPGDITSHLVLDPNVPPEARRILIERLGLDQPLHIQYVQYIGRFVTGDLGVSFRHYPREVTEILWELTPRTIVLFLTATVAAYWLGFWSGKLVAWRRGGFFEYSMTVVGVLLYTVFLPWFALLMIWVFGFVFGWFPIRGFLTPSLWLGQPYHASTVFLYMLGATTVLAAAMVAVWALTRRLLEPRSARLAAYGGWAALLLAYGVYWSLSPIRALAANITQHTILPVLTLTLVTYGGVMLLTRSAMLETLREDYILTARAKGLPERVVRNRHAARNALLPVVTSLVIGLAFVISGGIITETIFAWPGLGRALLESAVAGDVPLALGALAFLGVIALLGHIVVDIVYMYLDPRIRY